MRRASFVALLLLVLLPGCGGGNGATPLTKEEYASRADAICGKYNQQTKTRNPSNLTGLAKVADKTLSILDKAITDLKQLKPPASEKAIADQWLTQVENLKSDLAEIRDKAKANDTPGVQAVLPKAQDHNTRSNELASRLGMSVCNQD